MSRRPRVSVAALAAVLALGACSKPAPQSELDKADERTGLGDEILVDPALAHGERQAGIVARPRHGNAHGLPDDAGPHEAAPPAPPPPQSATAIKAPTPPAPHALAEATQPSPPPPHMALKPPAATVQTAKATKPPAPVKTTPATVTEIVAGPKAPTQAAAAKRKAVSPKTTRSAGNCLAKMQPGTSWATKLPTGFPLYPQAKLIDAAGINKAGCTARAVSFTVAAPPATVIGWYRARVTKAGFDASVERSGKDEILAGTGPDDSAYVITFGRRAAGVTNVDMIVNGAQ